MRTMKAKTAFILMILVATIIPVGALGEWLIVSIPDSESDVWMTEAGNIFAYESSVRLLHGEIGIHAFIRFEDVGLVKADKINYATLYVYAGFDQGEASDPGAVVTIYGIDEPDCTPFSYSGRIWSLSRAYTSANVNWDLSNWTYGWHSVNVTDIVKEIVNQYAWAENNSLGFQILGGSNSGHEVRTFEDIDHQHHGAYAYLYIQYNDAGERPPGLPPTAVFNETYGEYDIWKVNFTEGSGYPLDEMEYVFTYYWMVSPHLLKYDTVHSPPGTPVTLIADTDSAKSTYAGNTPNIVRKANGDIYVLYDDVAGLSRNIYCIKSEDNGTTWIDIERVSTYPGMDTNSQSESSLAVDSLNNLHAVWKGKATGFTTETQIWYANYTTSWSTPIRISTYENMNISRHDVPGIALDSEDNLHVTWFGKAVGIFDDYQIWYVNYNNSWTTPIVVSNYTGMNSNPQMGPALAVDGQDNIHVVWNGMATGFGNHEIWWINYTDSWSYPVRLSTYGGMEDYPQSEPSIAIDSQDLIHVTYGGSANGYPTDTQIWYNKYNVSWFGPTRISDYAGMAILSQYKPVIGVDSNDYLYILWQETGTGADLTEIHLSKYETDWTITERIQGTTNRNDYVNMRWARWPGIIPPTEDTFYVVDENNTVIETWNGENCTSLDCIEDWVDDNTGTGTGDPLDPTPGTQGWTTEGPFTRFKMRLYILFIGLGCLFTPLWAMAYKKLDAPGYAGCFIVMVMGVGLLWSITGI